MQQQNKNKIRNIKERMVKNEYITYNNYANI